MDQLWAPVLSLQLAPWRPDPASYGPLRISFYYMAFVIPHSLLRPVCKDGFHFIVRLALFGAVRALIPDA